MKRVLKLSHIASSKSNLFLFHRLFVPKSLIPDSTRCIYTMKPGSLSSKPVSDLYGLFANKWVYAEVRAKEELIEKVSNLRDELMQNVEDDYSFEKVLEVEGWNLFKIYSDGTALLELLKLFDSSLDLAIKVFNWRRRQEDDTRPMTSEEYAKGIKIAGKMHNLDLAIELFTESATKRVKNTSIYNALMSAYLCNGLGEKCQSVFRDLKNDIDCSPSIVTYNILISLFGGRVLVDQMEAIFQEMKNSNISPNLTTYNNLIAGYLRAWMWDPMENLYRSMETGPVQPDLDTRLLMLRGYAHSGNLEKMEELYNMIEHHIINEKFVLIRAMICAYCKSPDVNRVERIEELTRLIPENEYRPWLNVLLIRVYAEEDLVDQMEKSIDEAFTHNTSVKSVKIMRCIVSAYFRSNYVERLAKFVKRAENSGWRICRSLYHTLLCLYAFQKRIEEMEGVLEDMEKFNFGCSRGTYYILQKAYSEQEKYAQKFYRVLGLMCKHGHGIPSS